MEAENPSVTCCQKFCIFLKLYWRTFSLIIWPLVLLVLFLDDTSEKIRCLYVTLLMTGYWITEALPLSMTSLLPVILFPALNVLESEKTCKNYINDTNMMLIGGIMIAVCIEYSNLHNRVAMKVILMVGCSLRKLHFGVSLVTACVSMWITNTAATAMMLPVIVAVLKALEDEGILETTEPQDKDSKELPKPKRIPTAFFLTSAYCSSIGGVGTLIGTGTNLTFKGILETAFPKAPQQSFISWIIYCIIPTFISVCGTIVWLQIVFMGMFRPNSEEGKICLAKGSEEITRKVIEEKYHALGSITWHESMVGLFFLVAVTLWFFRKPQFIVGWGDLIEVKTGDSIPALFVIIVMFIIPASLDFLKHLCDEDQPERERLCIYWEILSKKTPWGLLFLLGGGFALSAGGKESGMALYLSQKLLGLKSIPLFGILCIICLITTITTEFMSNVAIANIILPVIVELAVALRVDPIYFLVPCTVFCSFAFHLPVGTPPNAIVSETSNLKTTDMMLAGIGPNIITYVVFLSCWSLYGKHAYGIDEFPAWAKESNGTRAN